MCETQRILQRLYLCPHASRLVTTGLIGRDVITTSWIRVPVTTNTGGVVLLDLRGGCHDACCRA